MQLLHRIAFGRAPDIVHVRRVVRRLAQLLGFDHRDQVKITAAVSELARAASSVGGGVVLTFAIEDGGLSCRLVIDVDGAGLAPRKRARGGVVAESLIAVERLLERLGGAGLRFAKRLPERATPLPRGRLAEIRAELEHLDPPRADLSHEELLGQTRELAEALLDLEDRKQELTTLNTELRDTNRGVMALYAELDERAKHLRRADELKTRFFSHMSHEFRTPLSSILALANMLLDEADGPLVREQRTQVRLIRDGVADLLELVGDLLDLAKMEAGKTPVNVGAFTVGALFGALRAMIRPLLATSPVMLELFAPADLPPLVSDEAKVMQILRNLLSNAAKFTERGTIEVRARAVSPGETLDGIEVGAQSVLFAVADTGVGIAAEHQAAIFEEFRQVENRLQRKSRGSGLGLPLCRRLAGLLGGRVWVESELGEGATFYLLLPVAYKAAPAAAAASIESLPRLLIVDERPDRRAELGAAFRGGMFLPIEASAADVTPASLAALRPTAAVVETGHVPPSVLDALEAATVPLVDARQASSVGSLGRDELVVESCRTALRGKLRSVLIVDDDEAYRTILTKQLAPFCERAVATDDPRADAVATGDGEVDCLVLDVMMPGVDGLTVLKRLRSSAATARLPIVVCSAKPLSVDEQALLRRLRAPFLPKQDMAAQHVARALVDARRLASVSNLGPQESAA